MIRPRYTGPPAQHGLHLHAPTARDWLWHMAPSSLSRMGSGIVSWIDRARRGEEPFIRRRGPFALIVAVLLLAIGAHPSASYGEEAPTFQAQPAPWNTQSLHTQPSSHTHHKKGDELEGIERNEPLSEDSDTQDPDISSPSSPEEAHLFSPSLLYQYSTAGAFHQGHYEGDLHLETLLTHGDFGIATLDELNGEIILLKAEPYWIQSDGQLKGAPTDAHITFTNVTFFFPEAGTLMGPIESYDQWRQALRERLNQDYPGLLKPLAIHATGGCSTVRGKTLERQQAPYLPWEKVLKREATLSMGPGTMEFVGFYIPENWTDIAFPGFQFLYMNREKTLGGRLLDLQCSALQVEWAPLSDFYLQLPLTPAVQNTLQSKHKPGHTEGEEPDNPSP